MLAIFRRSLATWPVRIFFGLLVVSFGLWGVADVIRNIGNDNAVASVAGRSIELPELQEAYRRDLARTMKMLGTTDPPPEIRRAVASITETTGERPLGWYCRYGPSVNTRELVVEEGGFLYDCDAYNDDLPYWTRVGDKRHLVIPYSLANNDGKFTFGAFGSPADFENYLKANFDQLYKEGATHPKMMSVGLHMRIVGHPGPAQALANFIEYAKSFPNVWFARRIDIARHWIDHHG